MKHRKEIEEAALSLPPEARSALALRLLKSVEMTGLPAVSPEWIAEINKRRSDVLSGAVKTIPGEDVSRKGWKIVSQYK